MVPRVLGEEGTWLAGLPLRVAQLTVPICVAVAVLRHRLLEIDLIVNRALMVALAAGLAAIGYVTVVVVIGWRDSIGGDEAELKQEEMRQLALLEVASTRPIVRQIVRAVEADKPRARYVAPWWQALGVRFLRVLGK